MKTIRMLNIFVFVMTLLNLTSAAQAGKYALVIGNGSYKAVPALDTPVNDANIMASSLRDLNFSVEKGTDMSQQEMETAIENFRKRLRPGDTALFYYSGHGVQVEGMNYMLPVEISKDKIRYNGVTVNIVLDKMEESGSKVNVIILDACRTDLKGGKGFGKGLAAMRGGEGTYIAYATAPGTEAFTGTGSTSIFTKYLASNIKTQGLKIEDMFKRVRKAVMDETGKEQKPWDSSMLIGDFYFSGEGGQKHESEHVEVQTPEPKRETVRKAKYQLRKTPITASDEDFRSKFRLDESKKPLEYIENDFRDNGDSTITDRTTGLMWQQSGTYNYVKYESAKMYIDELNLKKFAGYNDWRLPTVDELKSLLTHEKKANGKYINPIFDERQWWCWSMDKRSLGGMWLVGFHHGYIYYDVRGSNHVRAVRSLE